MTACPCCSHQLVRHIRPRGLYWFCSQCWAEMPNLSAVVCHQKNQVNTNHVSPFSRMVLDKSE